MAICAAASVAVAISAAIDAKPAEDVLNLAIEAAEKAESYRATVGRMTIAASIREIYDDLSRLNAPSVDYLADLSAIAQALSKFRH